MAAMVTKDLLQQIRQQQIVNHHVASTVPAGFLDRFQKLKFLLFLFSGARYSALIILLGLSDLQKQKMLPTFNHL